MTETVSLATIDGDAEFAAYVARPEGTPGAAIVVIQEIFGVNAGIRRKCDKLAEAGYLAIAPDLFWRLERGVELDADIEDQFQRGLALMDRFDQDAAIRDIEAAIRWARAQDGIGKVGAIGYCLGGRLAYMAAARTDSDATVGYYGVGIDGLLDKKHAIAAPLMLHVPLDDDFNPSDAIAAMHAGLDDHAKVTLHDYAGLGHGFATEFGARRDEDGAQAADARTADFFAQHLT